MIDACLQPDPLQRPCIDRLLTFSMFELAGSDSSILQKKRISSSQPPKPKRKGRSPIQMRKNNIQYFIGKSKKSPISKSNHLSSSDFPEVTTRRVTDRKRGAPEDLGQADGYAGVADEFVPASASAPAFASADPNYSTFCGHFAIAQGTEQYLRFGQCQKKIYKKDPGRNCAFNRRLTCETRRM